MSWLIVAGFLIFFLGMALSIALHELGHLVPAKLFGVKVTQYMVGFGPTVWSRRRGETEYGLKWIPFGGYIRMIGPLPPRPTDDPNKLRNLPTGPWQGLIETARQASLEEVRPGDENRVLYRKPWWQRFIIFLGGPLMNFLLAFALFAVVFMGFGVEVAKPVVAKVSQCVMTVAQESKGQKCDSTFKPTPAALAGLRPNDAIVSFDGKPVRTWEDATGYIRSHGAGPVTIGIRRDGAPMTLTTSLIAQDRPSVEEPGKVDKGVGFLGVTPVSVVEKQGLGYTVGAMWNITSRTAHALSQFPQRLVGVWQAAFGGAERQLDSPQSIVGAGRIGGEIAASALPMEGKIVAFIQLLAGVNLAIGMFNLIPLLPLDGGQIAGAVWEGLKRGYARVRRRSMPGHVDIAKALPLTYAMVAILLVVGGLLVYADIVAPIRLTG
ncbi:putative zinc metalloprotease [Sphaerisporangium krabiense]|uniref:Membrane-associated protease RseP (Regulator of RpoE activity) n=1 Tax=Sphaerisporangium krabiense TaxID=763782 RepID=A0A7W9DRE2_9ACTN|nr:M50 family metallopeptidase [Sphaerisporangium krabiense]MBB5628552.1 membrane-associated protease RseP (regulator of RpoE activity) [Sphaerisporangium krabiense]GII67193.1 putative zinc metalloprotease [Sphaerisporangium krabiense]